MLTYLLKYIKASLGCLKKREFFFMSKTDDEIALEAEKIINRMINDVGLDVTIKSLEFTLIDCQAKYQLYRGTTFENEALEHLRLYTACVKKLKDGYYQLRDANT